MTYRYFRKSTNPADERVKQHTRDEVVSNLTGWARNPEQAVELLEAATAGQGPDQWYQLTQSGLFRAERVTP